MLAVYAYAETFGQDPNEVAENVTTTDLAEFMAYMKIRNEEEKRAIDKARRGADKTPPRGRTPPPRRGAKIPRGRQR